MACQSPSPVSAITVWPHNHVLAGFGSLDGIVTLLDLRMWMPLSTGKTTHVSRLVPLGNNAPVSSYLVMNRDWLEVITEPCQKPLSKPRMTVRYQEKGLFRLVLPYLGGAIAVDDFSATFVHSNSGYPIVRLHDTSTTVLPVAVKGLTGLICQGHDQCTQSALSLHQHSGLVTCGVISKDVVVTCDDLGFIHRWRLVPEIVSPK